MSDNSKFVVDAFKNISSSLNLDRHQKNILANALHLCTKDCEVNYIEPVCGSFEEILQEYCDSLDMDGLAKDTIKNRRYTLREMDRYLHKNIEDIDISDLRSYLNYKRQKVQPNTINNLIAKISAFFTWLYEEEYIDKNPAKKLRKVKEPSRITKVINSVNLEKMRENCKNNRDRAILELAVATGLRVSELRNLNVSDLNFQTNRIRIVGKGNKERIVMFTDKVKYYIIKHLETRRDRNSDILFASVKEPFGRLGVRRIEIIVKDLKNVCEIPDKVTPHSFRHTMATTMIQSGADITTIQKLLGHSNINTTLIYANVDLDTLEYQYKKCMLG